MAYDQLSYRLSASVVARKQAELNAKAAKETARLQAENVELRKRAEENDTSTGTALMIGYVVGASSCTPSAPSYDATPCDVSSSSDSGFGGGND
ncbi:hypothetical protein [Caudoviricetes sp.]|nr:hypothetical protein [Caudoviricetes sp.]